MKFNYPPKLIKFPEHNIVFAKDQSQYRQLPAYKIPNDTQGRIIFCWQLSIWDRIKILFTGKIWHEVLTFNKPLQPQLLEINKPDLSYDETTVR